MLHITIHFLFYAPRPIAPLARYSEFLSSQVDDISHFQQLTSPLQIYTITHEQPIPLYRAAPHLRTFTPISTHGRAFSIEKAERLNDGNGAVDPYEQIVAHLLRERLYGGI